MHKGQFEMYPVADVYDIVGDPESLVAIKSVYIDYDLDILGSLAIPHANTQDTGIWIRDDESYPGVDNAQVLVFDHFLSPFFPICSFDGSARLS